MTNIDELAYHPLLLAMANNTEAFQTLMAEWAEQVAVSDYTVNPNHRGLLLPEYQCIVLNEEDMRVMSAAGPEATPPWCVYSVGGYTAAAWPLTRDEWKALIGHSPLALIRERQAVNGEPDPFEGAATH